MAKSKKLIGEEAFNAYYFELYGERWEALKESFLKENDSTEFSLEGCRSYYLDSASVTAAKTLPVENADEILDLCAAPGGKTLILASRMSEEARLVSNERSPERKMRLSKVVAECLPENISSRITVLNGDGAKLCLRNENTERFDSILLDAPCSSERHVFNDKKYLDVWTPSRIKTLAIAQWSLLSSAWRMLKKGGYLLYSTCALNIAENDGVIEKLLKKFEDVELCEAGNGENPGEKTKFGHHILPDVCDGAGPIYYCLCRKKD